MEESQEPLSKRARPSDTVACTECRTRKTRCNRELPCDSCIKRGTPQDCKPEMRKYPPSLSGLNNTVLSMQQRIDQLESRMALFEQKVQVASDSQAFHGLSVSEGFNFLDNFDNNQDLGPGGGNATTQNDTVRTVNHSGQFKTVGELSTFVSGKAALKDFDILETSKRSIATTASPAARYASTASSYPSIRSPTILSHTSWRASLLLALHSVLPPMASIRSAVQLYMDYCAWSMMAINSAQLAAEVDELDHLLQQDLFLQIDPAWVALIFQVMAQGSMSAYMCQDGQGDHLHSFAQSMADAAEGAMVAANLIDRPQIRIIQVLLLRARWLDHVDPDSGLLMQGSRLQGIGASIALSHAQALGLDMLGDDRNTMPEPDLSLPAHPCEFKRQIALRIWSQLKVVFLLNGLETQSSVPASFDTLSASSAPFDPVPDADLKFALVPPRDFLLTWETAFQQFHIAVTVDLTAGLRTMGSGVVELAVFEEHCHSQMEMIRATFNSLPAEGMPACWVNHNHLMAVLTIFEWGVRLRVRRSTLNAPDAEIASDSHTHAAIKAAVILGQACTEDAAIRFIKMMPTIVLYMLNAAVMISVAIKVGGPHQCGTDLSLLLLSIIHTLGLHGRSSLNAAIATNTQRAIDALFRLVKRLAQSADTQHGVGTVQGHDESQLLVALRSLAELSTSPDAKLVLSQASNPALHGVYQQQQQQSLALNTIPSYQSLALLEGMDFVKWTEGLLDNWDVQL